MIKGNKIKEIAEDIPIKGNTFPEEQQQTQQTRLTQKDKQCSLTAVKAIGMFLPLVTSLSLLLWVLIKF